MAAQMTVSEFKQKLDTIRGFFQFAPASQRVTEVKELLSQASTRHNFVPPGLKIDTSDPQRQLTPVLKPSPAIKREQEDHFDSVLYSIPTLASQVSGLTTTLKPAPQTSSPAQLRVTSHEAVTAGQISKHKTFSNPNKIPLIPNSRFRSQDRIYQNITTLNPFQTSDPASPFYPKTKSLNNKRSFSTMRANTIPIAQFEEQAEINLRSNSAVDLSKGPKAVPLTTARSPHTVSQLYEICQGRGIVVEFEAWSPEGENYQFLGKITLTLTDGTKKAFTTERPQNNKKEAKHFATELALEWVKSQPAPERPRKASVAKITPNKAEEPAEKWTVILYEYFQSSPDIGQVREQAFELQGHYGSMYSHEITTPFRPEPFGDRNEPFQSKKAARNDATRQAVLWLREKGHISSEGPAAKKQKMKLPDGSAVNAFDELNRMCTRLGFDGPAFEVAKDAGSSSMFSGRAQFFDQRAPEELRGRTVGVVRRQLGKAKAKAELARQVVIELKKFTGEIPSVPAELESTPAALDSDAPANLKDATSSDGKHVLDGTGSTPAENPGTSRGEGASTKDEDPLEEEALT
ncbi:hypothetical protein BT63DRAFT_481265 [Microthyrium microscopicum]|uniref:DRBM domain-containing protein n=1 Tax=Microthyrium microscopicum TaxID=703497 RepID=A0A6A6U679_9PEZI|nr:hypothetical protein BT63DRAFT_481265 [Microthyrium microscopicum]